MYLVSSNSNFPNIISKGTRKKYHAQTETPFLNILLLHKGSGNTMARYFVNSQMIYLASPQVFADVQECKTFMMPRGLHPQALKLLIDYRQTLKMSERKT